MRWILISLALLVAVPAQAQQTGLPVWLVGTWCGDLGGPAADGGSAPELCDSWVAGDDGTLQNRITPQEGTTSASGGDSTGAISIEQGRLVLRGGFGGKITVNYREVSRGPNEVVFENLIEGPLAKLGLRREGDDLIEELWFTGRTEPQRTVYHLRK